MIDPIPLTPEIAIASGTTYQELLDDALVLLAKCGKLTMIEQDQHGMKHPAVSANECLGMATRVIAEAALQIQTFADAEEFNRAQG